LTCTLPNQTLDFFVQPAVGTNSDDTVIDRADAEEFDDVFETVETVEAVRDDSMDVCRIFCESFFLFDLLFVEAVTLLVLFLRAGRRRRCFVVSLMPLSLFAFALLVLLSSQSEGNSMFGIWIVSCSLSHRGAGATKVLRGVTILVVIAVWSCLELCDMCDLCCSVELAFALGVLLVASGL